MSSNKISQKSHRNATQLTAFTYCITRPWRAVAGLLSGDDGGHSLMWQYWSISLAFCLAAHAHSDNPYRQDGRLVRAVQHT